jgi:hypothetical protein
MFRSLGHSFAVSRTGPTSQVLGFPALSSIPSMVVICQEGFTVAVTFTPALCHGLQGTFLQNTLHALACGLWVAALTFPITFDLAHWPSLDSLWFREESEVHFPLFPLFPPVFPLDGPPSCTPIPTAFLSHHLTVGVQVWGLLIWMNAEWK